MEFNKIVPSIKLLLINCIMLLHETIRLQKETLYNFINGYPFYNEEFDAKFSFPNDEEKLRRSIKELYYKRVPVKRITLENGNIVMVSLREDQTPGVIVEFIKAN